MIQTFRIIWTDLKKSILVGERYERNMRGIKLVALLIVIVNFITGELNLLSGFYSAAVTSPLFIVAGLLILYFTHFRQDRKKDVCQRGQTDQQKQHRQERPASRNVQPAP